MGAMPPTDHSLRLDGGALIQTAVPVHPRAQVGALCWRRHKGARQVLLVTSRETRRWIVPKGWVMDSRAPARSALTEAWEEAGVQGRVDDTALGQFVYLKVLSDGIALPVRVTLYPVEVLRLKARYPEAGQRDRAWFTADNAARELANPDLARLLADWAATRDPRPSAATGNG